MLEQTGQWGKKGKLPYSKFNLINIEGMIRNTNSSFGKHPLITASGKNNRCMQTLRGEKNDGKEDIYKLNMLSHKTLPS